MLEFTDANDADAFQGAASVLSLVTALVGEVGRDGLSALDEDCVSGLWHVLDMASISLGQAAVVAQQRKEAQEAARKAQSELAAMGAALKKDIRAEAGGYDQGYMAGVEAGRQLGKREFLGIITQPEAFEEKVRFEQGWQAAMEAVARGVVGSPTPAETPLQAGGAGAPVPTLTEPAPERNPSQAVA